MVIEALVADLAIVWTAEALPTTIQRAQSNPPTGAKISVVGYSLGGELTTTNGRILRYGPDPIGLSLLPMIYSDAPHPTRQLRKPCRQRRKSTRGRRLCGRCWAIHLRAGGDSRPTAPHPHTGTRTAPNATGRSDDRLLSRRVVSGIGQPASLIRTSR